MDLGDFLGVTGQEEVVAILAWGHGKKQVGI